MLTLDETFAMTSAGFPHVLREYAQTLPHRLGLGSSQHTRWEDVVQLAPNRVSPYYAAEVIAGGTSSEVVEGYCRAHHCAAFFGMVADAVEDRPESNTQELLTLRRLFLRGWTDALALATGDAHFARASIADALLRWRRGLRWERRVKRQPRIDAQEYARMVQAKLSLMGATAVTLLRAQRRLSDVAGWQLCHDHFLVGLQCIDDAADADEDDRLTGASIPERLGQSAATLFRTAFHLVDRAASHARSGGFVMLAEWLNHFSSLITEWIPVEQSPSEEWCSLILAGQMMSGLET